MLLAFPRLNGRATVLMCAIAASSLGFVAEAGSISPTLIRPPLPVVTNCFQARQLGVQNPAAAYQIRLEGQVCWVSRAQKSFAFLDASGGLILRVDALPQLPRIGERLRLTGLGTIS